MASEFVKKKKLNLTTTQPKYKQHLNIIIQVPLQNIVAYLGQAVRKSTSQKVKWWKNFMVDRESIFDII